MSFLCITWSINGSRSSDDIYEVLFASSHRNYTKVTLIEVLCITWSIIEVLVIAATPSTSHRYFTKVTLDELSMYYLVY